MFKQIGDIEQRTRDNFPDGIFARLPNAVALDKSLAADGLVYVAARLTWADQKGRFRASDALLKQIGMGRERARKARSIAKACRYLLRYQPHNPARGEKAAVAVERLTLPMIGGEQGYRLVWRSWFDAAGLDITSRPKLPAIDRIKALAAILYMNAMGRRVFARELATRFGWSRPTAAAVLAALGHAGIVDRHEQRDARGRISSVRYSTVKKLGDGFLGDGNAGDIRKRLTYEAPSEQFPYEGSISYQESASRRDAPTPHEEKGEDGIGEIVDDLRRRDLNRVVASPVWRDRGGIKHLVDVHGASAVIEIVKSRLIDAMIDGRRRGSIRSWRYFIGALEDHATRCDLMRRGERPGDVLGAHRRAPSMKMDFDMA
ncbi:hypothetical protein [Hyphomicrobium zavarzinii]|uniref:hypothetical protein n=1 Tax=Hyphomicrobium zavarzinii TaxID=48292 RepID=UPI00036DB4E7|nr:hypothetical protein [Hyphomicrobium zavarzinii]